MYQFSYDKVAVGARIQKKRNECNYTQEALAEAIECSVRHIVDMERGAVGMSIETLLKLCSILKTTPNALLLPDPVAGHADLEWLMHSLNQMQEADRQTALEILKPFIEHVQR